MPSFSGARAKLKTATQDLFRLTGGHSIPVDAPSAPAPAAASMKPPEQVPSSARKPEASIMFSLEELMKANPISIKRDDTPDQLWSTHGATPLFGTAHDQALLTTPMKKEPSPTMDSMTVPSRPLIARRWLPVALAIGGSCLAVAGAGWWFMGNSQAELAPEAPIAVMAAVPPAAASPAEPERSPETEVVDSPAPAERSEPAPTAATVSDPVGDVVPVSAVPAPPKGKAALAKEKRASKKASAKPALGSITPKAAASSFDKTAAKSALNAAASQSAGCRQGGSAGKGKIVLTFAPSGKVTSASIAEGPFSGTAAGKCALRHFRAARVPAFSGTPVTVSKSFTIQ
jgi:hypothetical protein